MAFDTSLNCLSAGSVSLTFRTVPACQPLPCGPSQLPFGWVCFSNESYEESYEECPSLNCLSAGSVSLTPRGKSASMRLLFSLNCLSAGSVSLTETSRTQPGAVCVEVSIAFRLGLFL